ncbi:hypothetical protein ZWY2020_006792 [Hordeum vulgare]|nr:hypothetical protein ZWY2020_006792 [Hordeum vulgare]
MDAAGAGSSSKPTPPGLVCAGVGGGLHQSCHGQTPLNGGPVPQYHGPWRTSMRTSLAVAGRSSEPSPKGSFFKEMWGNMDSSYFPLATQCKERMCLYGYPDGKWSLTLPEKMLPPGLPEPKLGINRRPEYMNRYDYLSFVTRHSDSWLMGVALFLTTLLDVKLKC